MSPRTLFTNEYCPPGHYSPVNNVPPPPPPPVYAFQGSLVLLFCITSGSAEHARTGQQQRNSQSEVKYSSL